MHPLAASVPTLSISVIFCLYNACRRVLQQREQRRRRLCERIAYMLWVIVTRADVERPEETALL